MTAPQMDVVKRYYDERIDRKIWDFTSANPRIEAAFDALLNWLPENAANILEIGCGIGATAWRIARICRNAQVLGTDVSPRSIDFAQACFRAPNLAYRELIPSKGALATRFEYVVMMDVYEHIAIEQRPELHGFLADGLTERGRIFLSFPTPQHLKFLKASDPDEIQPIDENITLDVLARLATDIGGRLLYYQEVSIWKSGDYAHAVVGRDESMLPVPQSRVKYSYRSAPGFRGLFDNALKLSRRQRERVVRSWSRLEKS